MSNRRDPANDIPSHGLVADDRTISSGESAALISDLAGQLMGIAQNLLRLSGIPTDHGPTPPSSHGLASPTANQRPNNLQQARAIYQVRRSRTTIFDHPEIFGEPAWDILLDLYIATAEGKDISVSSACIGSAVPPTTGLRWLRILADKGLIIRRHDPLDQRRVLVHLTRDGLEMMDKFFEAAEARTNEIR